MKEFIENMSGGLSVGYWASALVMSFLGFLLFKSISYTRRSKKEPWDLDYWFSDNLADIVCGAIMFYAWVRFKNAIIPAASSHPVVSWIGSLTDEFYAHFLFGLLFTWAVKVIRKKLQTLMKS